MATLPELAFAFARFVARRRRPRFAFGNASFRRSRRAFGPRRRGRPDRNGGLRRHHRGNRWVPRRRYGPGGGLRRRLRGNRWTPRHHNHYGNRWTQRRNYPGAPGPSTSAAVPQEQAPAIPQSGLAAPETTAGPSNVDGQVAANIAQVPPPPIYAPMEWLLSGPSAGWLVDDPERVFEEELGAPPPPPLWYPCPRHGYGPCLPSPTPSDEDPEHIDPPGYASISQFFSPPVAVSVDEFSPGLIINLPPEVKTEEATASAPPEVKTEEATASAPPEVEKEEVESAGTPAAPALVVPDLNLPAPAMEEQNENVAPTFVLPTPSPEARVILRRFAAAMAARPAGIRAGTWSPEALGLTGRIAELRLHEADPHSSSSAEGLRRR